VAGIARLVGPPGGAQDQPANLLDFHRAVGQHPLDRLVVGDRVSERDPLAGVLASHLQQPLRLADGARRDQQAALADPRHRQLETATLLTQRVLGRYPDIVELQLGRPPGTHGFDPAAGPAHLPVDEEGGDAALVALALVGDSKDDREVGLAAVGDEDLLPVENPIGPVADRRHLDVGGVRAGVRFGQREATLALALDRGDEVALALGRGALIKDVVGAPAVDERHQRLGGLDRDQGRHQVAEVGAAVFLRCQQAPEAGLAGRRLQLTERRTVREMPSLELGTLDPRFQRHELLLDERAHGAEDHSLFVAE